MSQARDYAKEKLDGLRATIDSLSEVSSWACDWGLVLSCSPSKTVLSVASLLPSARWSDRSIVMICRPISYSLKYTCASVFLPTISETTPGEIGRSPKGKLRSLPRGFRLQTRA